MNSLILEKAETVVDILKRKNKKIATAESCTGGLVSSYITAVSGSSSVLELGITSYSNRIKKEILSVKEETLKNSGAVSEDTAKQMAQNVREISGADIGVSVTGVAGPDPLEEHPVGFVIIGFSNDKKTIANTLHIPPENRNFIREQAVLKLLELIIIEEIV